MPFEFEAQVIGVAMPVAQLLGVKPSGGIRYLDVVRLDSGDSQSAWRGLDVWTPPHHGVSVGMVCRPINRGNILHDAKVEPS